MLRNFFLSLLLGVSFTASAVECTATSFTCTTGGFTYSGQGNSQESACGAAAAACTAAHSGGSNPMTCAIGARVNATTFSMTYTDSGGTGNNFAMVNTSTCTPPVVDTCTPKAGQSTTVNFTEGYTRTTEEGDRAGVGPINTPPADGIVCSAGCKVAAQTSGPGVQPYVSLTPTAQGLYRRSLDLPAQHLGQSCSAGAGGAAGNDASVSPVAASPTCPGFVGEVNGKTGCYGTAAKPVIPTTIPRSADKPPVPGNPAAGSKPATGEGSGSTGAGRTPAAGDGGNAGGPASAAVGPKGTVSKPVEGEEQAACGAPGQPKCQIDETGTPTGTGEFDSGKTALDTNKDSVKTAIDGAANIQVPAWTFSFALPTGCTAYNTGIKGFVMNPCQYQSTIHDLMSMVWAAVTAFCIIGMVGRTIRES